MADQKFGSVKVEGKGEASAPAVLKPAIEALEALRVSQLATLIGELAANQGEDHEQVTIRRRVVDRARFLEMVVAERKRQIERWGNGNPGVPVMLAVLGEEFGEACQAMLKGDGPNLEEELVQIAAVACRMFELFNGAQLRNLEG